MDGLEKCSHGTPDKPKYIPGEFTDAQYRHPSHADLLNGIYVQHTDDHKGRGYPRYRDDFLAPVDEGCQHKTRKNSPKCEKIKKETPYLAAAKNFVFAKKLHKENLEHDPLPDTIADAMYRKSQMLGGQPGLMLKDGNFATGVGWKGYPGFGATRCTKLKVFRPKTCVHSETKQKTKRPMSISSFDKKWRFIRQQKVTPIELAICWDLTPINICDEPHPPKHIDGSNGSQAPAVFALVHTPKENMPKIEEDCSCEQSPKPNKESPKTEKIRPKSAWEIEHPICSHVVRSKSAYNINQRPKPSEKSSHSSSLQNKKFYKSTPTICSGSNACAKCAKRNELLPNARLCVACELKDTEPKQKPKTEFKAAFKAGVPNNNKCVSWNTKINIKIPKQRDPYANTNYTIVSLAPPFSFQSGKRHEYPDHWRLASVYQHSYKPVHLRKRSLLASIFL